MVKITSVHGATDGGRSFAATAVPEVESGLEKDALNRWPTRKAILHPQLITYNQDVIIQIDISQKKKPSYPNPVGRPKCTRVSKSQQKSHKKIAAVCKVDADGCY